MRVPVGRVKDAKYLLLKMPVITLMKKKMKRIQKDRNWV
jgi:hypothetical protein